MQTNCTQCGSSVSADAKFCPTCGATVTSTPTTKKSINVQASIVKLMVGRPWQRTNAKLIAQDLANFTSSGLAN